MAAPARDAGRDRPSWPARGRDGDRSRDGARGGDRSWGSERGWSSGRERPGGGSPRSGDRARGSERTWAGRDEAPARPPRESGPQLPDSVTPDQLDPEARSQLNSLPNDLADIVARYLVAADLADDPEQGYAYAQAAKRLAARVGVVREACGIIAYRTGRWAEALSELRAARRMTGCDDYLPIMADCERALGRLDRALALVREASTADLDRATQIELRIVESGIRRDQGLADAAVLALQVPELTRGRLRPWSARLFYAYADALLAAGRADEARDAFVRAVQADPDGETDAADRLDQLDGIEFDDLEDDDLEDDDLDLDASDLHDIDAEADKPEEGGLDDADGDDPGECNLDEGIADEGHADEEDPTASHPS
jgi:tetratricopeptide (TPR) repeat protein